MCSKLLTIIGLLLQLIGVFLLAKSDLLTKRTEEALKKIPNNPYLDAYEAARDDRERHITKEENEYNDLAKQNSVTDSLAVYKCYLTLIGLGMFFQLIGVICG